MSDGVEFLWRPDPEGPTFILGADGQRVALHPVAAEYVHKAGKALGTLGALLAQQERESRA